MLVMLFGLTPEILFPNVMKLQEELRSFINEILLELQKTEETDKKKFEKMKEDIFNNGHRLISV